MIGWPILARELQRAQRRRRTYGLRWLAAMAAVVWLWGQLEPLAELVTGASVGRSLFFSLAGMMFLGALASGVLLTAPCLREEKESRMLELLLLTDQRPRHLVLAKLTAHSLAAVQVLFAALPVLAVPVVIGGVSLNEFLRMSGLLLLALGVSLLAGLWMAAVCTRARTAMFSTLVGLIGLTLGWLAVDDALVERLGMAGEDRFVLPGIVQAFALVSELREAGSANSFGASFSAVLVLVPAFFGLTCLRLPRACVDATVVAPRARTARLGAAARAKESRRRRRVLRRNPMLWLAARRSWPAWRSSGMLLAVGVVWLASWFHFGGQEPALRFVALLGTPFVVHGFMKVIAAARSAGGLAFARGTGELELLLVTGLSARRLTAGLRHAWRRELLGPLAVVAGLDVSILLAGERWLVGEERAALWLLTWLMVVMLAADLCVLERFGMWQGLLRPNVLQAVTASVLAVIILPGLLFYLTVWFAPSLYLYGWILDDRMGWVFGAGCWWLFVGSASDAVFYFRAKRCVENQLRQLASGTPRSLWPDLLGPLGLWAKPRRRRSSKPLAGAHPAHRSRVLTELSGSKPLP